MKKCKSIFWRMPSFSPRWLHNGYGEAFELVKSNGGSEFVAHKLKVLDSGDEGLYVDEKVAESEAKEPDSKRLRFEGQMSVAANPFEAPQGSHAH